MKYQWKLKSIESGYTRQKGQIEAEDQDKAVEKLNKEMDIQPHVGELLEIITPDDLSSPGMRSLVLT